MGTRKESASLTSGLFGKTRRAVLALLYGHPEDAFYLRQLVRSAGVGLGAAQREVKRLSEAGIVRRMVRGRQVYYQADPQCPVFSELKILVAKTVGVGDVLRTALAPLAERIHVAFLYGSLARGEEHPGSDVDILVVGEVAFGEIVSALGPAQEALSREINPTVYSLTEFRAKLAAGHHFLTTVVGEKRTFLIGDERELARLAPKRRVTEHRSSAEEIRELLALADRDLRDCQTLGLSTDWRFNIAYNAALQAATAALAATGFRAARDAHDYRVIQSLALTIGADSQLVRAFDAFRKKRNLASYERGGAISDQEAEEMAALALDVRKRVERWIKTRRPKLL